ncbi:hypothetical protein [Lacihabitans soyangensis]|uniref:Uncharacterized protein n=1 Tax=Lacihabitans soyangensis TaxID=869394 RepID=A0AAE3H138_9BACT|nr:hypothetical protein [Lacihabitans soyangensis]MCP9762350.1 hypothetical protein [Lacihabitans soyangensis]
MKENPFLFILKELEVNGFGKYFNISPILANYYPKHGNEKDEKNIGEVKELLNIMQDERLLVLHPSGFGSLGNSSAGIFYGLGEVEIKVTISTKGLNYLSEHRNLEMSKSINQSVIDTNIATKKFLCFQKITIITTLMVSIVTLIFSVKDNEKEIRNLNRSISEKLEKINITMSKLNEKSLKNPKVK